MEATATATAAATSTARRTQHTAHHNRRQSLTMRASLSDRVRVERAAISGELRSNSRVIAASESRDHRHDPRGGRAQMFRTAREMCDERHPESTHPPLAARICGSIVRIVTDPRVGAPARSRIHNVGPGHPNVAKFVGLEPFSVIEQVQKQEHACPAASSGASTSTFGQPNSPRHSSLLCAELRVACIGGSASRA